VGFDVLTGSDMNVLSLGYKCVGSQPLGVFMLVCCLAYYSTLKMEAVCFSEISVGFQMSTQRYIPEHIPLQNTIITPFQRVGNKIVSSPEGI
jgi:hypothetical protein